MLIPTARQATYEDSHVRSLAGHPYAAGAGGVDGGCVLRLGRPFPIAPDRRCERHMKDHQERPPAAMKNNRNGSDWPGKCRGKTSTGPTVPTVPTPPGVHSHRSSHCLCLAALFGRPRLGMACAVGPAPLHASHPHLPPWPAWPWWPGGPG